MLVVGLDLGTQSCKAVVVDDGLRVRGRHAVPYATTYPAPDHAEQAVEAWEAALGGAIAGALERAGAAPGDIRALAIAGQLDGCVAVDAHGTALHPALIWQDRRATTEATRVAAAELFARTGQVADASHLAPKAAWLIARGVTAARFHVPVSYLVERLTGEAVIDVAHATTTMLAELATGAWAPALLAAFGLDEHRLPVIRPTCAVAGRLTGRGARLSGLAVGTPVAVGTGDDFANPLGAGLVAPGSIVCAIGTAEVVGAIAAAPVLDTAGAEPMVETHAFPTGAYFVENPGWLSGGAVRWAVRLLGLPDEAALDALAATAPPGAGGVTFVPALAGAMTPVWRAHARGAFHGLAASHDREHLARAVLEGLAFACRDVVDRLAELGLPTPALHLLGGGSTSAVWAQLRADVLRRAHHVSAEPDACPLGAAMIALVAAGGVHDLAAAAALVAPPGKTFTPGAAVVQDALDAAYRRYQAVTALLIPTWASTPTAAPAR